MIWFASRLVPFHARISMYKTWLCLQVSPITIVASDLFYEFEQRIAVNDLYICYSLKAGQVRALHKSTGRRALLKSSSAPPDVWWEFALTSACCNYCWPGLTLASLPDNMSRAGLPALNSADLPVLISREMSISGTLS